MTTISLVFLLLAAVIFGTNAAFIDRKCMAVGLMCKNCNDIKLCTRNGTVIQEEQIGTCKNGATCFNGACTNEKNPVCMRLYDYINCQSVGYFPDPYNCQIYHHCIAQVDGIKDIPKDCPDGFAYNPRTQTCDTRLPANRCDSTLIPLCTTIGQHGAFENDRNIYYICKEDTHNNLLPYLYKCPGNQVYDGYYGCY